MDSSDPEATDTPSNSWETFLLLATKVVKINVEKDKLPGSSAVPLTISLVSMFSFVSIPLRLSLSYELDLKADLLQFHPDAHCQDLTGPSHRADDAEIVYVEVDRKHPWPQLGAHI